MYQLISRKIKEVTPLLAEKILEANTYDGQRPLSEKQVKILSEAIEEGLFTVGHIAVAHQGWNVETKWLPMGNINARQLLELAFQSVQLLKNITARNQKISLCCIANLTTINRAHLTR